MRFASLLPGLTLASGVLALVGCTQILDIRDTTDPIEVTAGSGGSGGNSTPKPGSCAGDLDYKGDDAVTIDMSMITFAPPNSASAGIQVEAYKDINSFGLFRDPVFCGATDADGKIKVHVPGGSTGFAGFLIVKGSEQETFFYYFSPPRVQNDPPFTFLTISNNDWSALRDQVIGLPNKPDSGQVTINALDQNDKPLAGVRFEIDIQGDGQPFFFTSDGSPSLTAKQTDPNFAFGGFFNVPAAGGRREVRMLDATSGELLGSVNINILAGTWTTMRIKSNKPAGVTPADGG